MPLTTWIRLVLVMLLREWRIEPSAVTGHSTGEVGGLRCAGIDHGQGFSMGKGFALGIETLDFTSTNRSYTLNLAPKKLIDDLNRVGVSYGRLFQNLQEIDVGNGSVTTIIVSDLAAVMQYSYRQPR
jgi:hypothetical protein